MVFRYKNSKKYICKNRAGFWKKGKKCSLYTLWTHQTEASPQIKQLKLYMAAVK